MIAYKGLVKEKEALEASVTVLSSKGATSKHDERKVESAEESEKEDFVDPLHANVSIVKTDLMNYCEQTMSFKLYNIQ